MIEVSWLGQVAQFEYNATEWVSFTDPDFAKLLNYYIPEQINTVYSIYFSDGKKTNGFKVEGRDGIALSGIKFLGDDLIVTKYRVCEINCVNGRRIC